MEVVLRAFPRHPRATVIKWRKFDSPAFMAIAEASINFLIADGVASFWRSPNPAVGLIVRIIPYRKDGTLVDLRRSVLPALGNRRRRVEQIGVETHIGLRVAQHHGRFQPLGVANNPLAQRQWFPVEEKR